MRRPHPENTQEIEARLGLWLRQLVGSRFSSFALFVVKFAWASLFGGALLAGLIISHMIWESAWTVARYDALLLYAIVLQAALIWLRIETWSEMRVIFLFHLSGTLMEIFKVHMGSWDYPEAGLFVIFGVPLFSGFMYASVGSFIARAIRVCDMTFAPFPPLSMLFSLGGLIYLNFFTHHFMMDFRIVLIALTVLVFWKTRIWFRLDQKWYWMPLPLAAFLSSFFLWLAENIGTHTNTWLYLGRAETLWVSLSKMGSWYMLLYLSLATVMIVYRSHIMRTPWQPNQGPE